KSCRTALPSRLDGSGEPSYTVLSGRSYQNGTRERAQLLCGPLGRRWNAAGTGAIDAVAFLGLHVEMTKYHRSGQRLDAKHDLTIQKDAYRAGRLADRDGDGLGLARDGGGSPVAGAWPPAQGRGLRPGAGG